MIKPLSLLSISTVALLATTQAHSHVLCAPNNPQFSQPHSHNQVHKVPRIQVSNHNQQKHLQAQRARQQKALANQQRINQQRRAQALAKQQQDRARKVALIQQQRLAAQRAQAARQRAAQAAAQRVRVQQRQVASKPVYRQPAPVQTVRYVAPAPTRVYVPSRSHISVQVSTGINRQHQHHVNNHAQRSNARHHQNRTRAQVRQYHSRGNAHAGYRYVAKPQHRVGNRHIKWSNERGNMHSGKNIYYVNHK